jgi:hypothetical protein
MFAKNVVFTFYRFIAGQFHKLTTGLLWLQQTYLIAVLPVTSAMLDLVSNRANLLKLFRVKRMVLGVTCLCAKVSQFQTAELKR